MACQKTNKSCNCDFNIKSFGLCDPKRIIIDGQDRTVLNWSEISVPEILCVPEAKPDIENLDQIYATADLTSVKLIETPFAYEIINRAASDTEITSLNGIITTVDTLISDVGDLFTPGTGLISLVLELITNSPLDVPPGLGVAVPDILTNTIVQVETALYNLSQFVTSLNAPLTAPLLASLICSTLETLKELIGILESTLKALISALNATVAAIDPTGVIIGTAVNNVIAAINTILTNSITTILSTINSLILTLGTVSYLTISKNEEGTCLTGRKLVIEGFLNQKVVYTGEVETQSVHSAHYSVPFSAFIIVYAKFDGLDYVSNVTINTIVNGVVTPVTISGVALSCDEEIPDLVPDLCEEFCVDAYIEDVFATTLDVRTIFKNVTLFFLAKPSNC